MNNKEIRTLVSNYAKPSNKKAIWQMINTIIPYGILIYVMYLMIYHEIPYIFTFLFSIIPGLLLVRIFIFFHDCTHKSFLSNNKAMVILGNIFGILTFTNFYRWQREHVKHHSTVGNIDKRGVGDVWTMTVDEYNKSSRLKKFGYRLYRNPIVLFIIGPMYIFVINERLPLQNKTKRDWIGNSISNIGVLAIFLTVTFTIGIKYYLLIQLPVIFFASSLGVWLFFVQHQYEDVYWETNENWDVIDAALKGSSVYKLPRVLDWFTGYIGYHNVHHLNARVPNYNLKKLYTRNKIVQSKKEIKLFKSLKLMRLFLYDVKNKELITYRKYKKRNRLALNN